MTDDMRPPDRSKGDAARTIVKAAIGSVPGIGSAGAELFAYVVQAPYEKRREEWMQRIGNAIADLRDRDGIDVEALREDPAFTDTVLAATQAALRTRNAAKQKALRNAIVNSAAKSAPHEADRLTFIRLVDEMNEWHLLLLALSRDPPHWFSKNGVQFPGRYMGGLSSVIEAAFPQLRGRRDLYDQWWRELHVRGLVTVDHVHTTMSGHGLILPGLTSFGHEFVDFIENDELSVD